MFPIIVGNVDDKDLSDKRASTDLRYRKPQLYQLKRILDSAMGIYSLPIQVVEIILMPYLRIVPLSNQGFGRMQLCEASVDLDLWGPVLLEDGNPIAIYYEIIQDSHIPTVTEDQWNVFVTDFKKRIFRRNLENMQSDRRELLLANNSNITDIDPIVMFTHLSRLDMHRTKIHDLSPLGELALRTPMLTDLNLSHTLISDLEHLRGFTLLQSLNISHCIHVHNIDPIFNMKMLKTLHIDHTRVSSLESIPLDSLIYLNAAHTKIHDLIPLTDSNISELSLAGCKRIPYNGFSVLATLDLIMLSLSETNVLSQSIEIWKWPELSTLWLDDCPNFNSFPNLRKLRKLSVVSLSKTALNSLEPLHCVNLVKVCLNDSTFPSLSPISGLDIEELLLSGARFKLGPLSLPRLNALDISNTKDRCLLILNTLKNSPIAHLDLSHTSIVNLWRLTNFSKTLRRLDLSHTPVENIKHLSNCSVLESVDVSYTNVHDKDEMLEVVAARHRFLDVKEGDAQEQSVGEDVNQVEEGQHPGINEDGQENYNYSDDGQAPDDEVQFIPSEYSFDDVVDDAIAILNISVAN